MHHFVSEEYVLDIQPFGTGHINDTYAVTVADSEEQKNLVLQRINHEIFKHPEEVMENILHVTSHLRCKIAEAGGDCERETLVVIPDVYKRQIYRYAYKCGKQDTWLGRLLSFLLQVVAGRCV